MSVITPKLVLLCWCKILCEQSHGHWVFRCYLKFCPDTFMASSKAVPPHQCLYTSIPLVQLQEAVMCGLMLLPRDAGESWESQVGIIPSLSKYAPPLLFPGSSSNNSTVFCLAFLPTREMPPLSSCPRSGAQSGKQDRVAATKTWLLSLVCCCERPRRYKTSSLQRWV